MARPRQADIQALSAGEQYWEGRDLEDRWAHMNPLLACGRLSSCCVLGTVQEPAEEGPKGRLASR